MSNLVKEAMAFESDMTVSHFLVENQAMVLTVNAPYMTKAQVEEAGYEEGNVVYPEWVVDELRSEVERLQAMVEPHPPSRDCECQRCQDDFAEKDKTPSDGEIYSIVKPPPAWDETNAQKAIVMAMHGTPEQRKEATAFFRHHLNTNKKD